MLHTSRQMMAPSLNALSCLAVSEEASCGPKLPTALLMAVYLDLTKSKVKIQTPRW